MFHFGSMFLSKRNGWKHGQLLIAGTQRFNGKKHIHTHT